MHANPLHPQQYDPPPPLRTQMQGVVRNMSVPLRLPLPSSELASLCTLLWWTWRHHLGLVMRRTATVVVLQTRPQSATEGASLEQLVSPTQQGGTQQWHYTQQWDYTADVLLSLNRQECDTEEAQQCTPADPGSTITQNRKRMPMVGSAPTITAKLAESNEGEVGAGDGRCLGVSPVGRLHRLEPLGGLHKVAPRLATHGALQNMTGRNVRTRGSQPHRGSGRDSAVMSRCPHESYQPQIAAWAFDEEAIVHIQRPRPHTTLPFSCGLPTTPPPQHSLQAA